MNTKLNRQLVENYKIELNENLWRLLGRGVAHLWRYLSGKSGIGPKIVKPSTPARQAASAGINVGVPAVAGYGAYKLLTREPSGSPEFDGGGRGEQQQGRGDVSTGKKKYQIDVDRAERLLTAQTPEELTFTKAGASNRERALARNAIKARMKALKAAGSGPGSEEYESAKARYDSIAPITGRLQTQPRSNPAATTLGRLNQRGINISRPPQSEDEAKRRAEAMADIEAEDQELASQGKKFTGYDDRGQMYSGFNRRGYGIGVGKTEPKPESREAMAARISSEVDKDIERRMAEIRKNPKAYGIE